MDGPGGSVDVMQLAQSPSLFCYRFCGLKGHEMFCEVERSYIEDGFNLYGLRACVSNFSDCLDLILDRIGPDDSDDSHLTQSACTLYGLIHARYIITAHGLDAMYNKVSALRLLLFQE
jgi:casein kinase II subunit beta